MKVAMTVRNGNWEWEWPWELGLGLGLDDGQPLLLMAVTLFFRGVNRLTMVNHYLPELRTLRKPLTNYKNISTNFSFM